jgi:glycosyltransferase involved in cell wall biosynthesis
VLSLVLPIYRNEENIPDLLKAVSTLASRIPLEAVFVIDGSPDRSGEILQRELPSQSFSSRLIELSRNFGSFAAITAGLEAGSGEYFAMLAADLQEPIDLIVQFYDRLRTGEVDIVFGERSGRRDPFGSRLLSGLFWRMFRRFAVGDIPASGVDTFGCTRQVRDRLLGLREVDSSLVSLLFWIGFRREAILFERRERRIGKSAWTFRKKVDYAIYSFFNFTDIPVRLMLFIGAGATLMAVSIAVVIMVARLAGSINVPGYTPLALLVTFYGGLTTFGLGVIGQYVWLALQNARGRPNYIVRSSHVYGPVDDGGRSVCS